MALLPGLHSGTSRASQRKYTYPGFRKEEFRAMKQREKDDHCHSSLEKTKRLFKTHPRSPYSVYTHKVGIVVV